MYNENQPIIKKIAIYTRVSTDEQATGGYSLGAQLEKLQGYSKVKDWIIVGEYTDGGFTGRNANRPAYKKMFEEIEKWDAIVVIKMDRIHRNQKNFIEMMQQLEKQGKEFVSLNESFDTSTAMGRFVMSIMSGIAQLESEQIGERVSAALFQKAKSDEAGFMNHRPPYGYRWDPKLKKHIEEPEKLAKVKLIYQMYLDGWSMREIQVKIGASNTSLRYYLHNSFYTGMERWCNFFRKSDLQPVISIDDFNKVQKMMAKKCNSHKHDPLIIQKEKSFKINRETENNIPIIQRAKHNWTRAW